MIKRLFNKSLIMPIVLLTSAVLYLGTVGRSGSTHISGTSGCSCHSSGGSTNCVVTINGPSSVAVNSVNTYTIVVSGTGSSLGGGAIDIATDLGKITTTDTYLKTSGTAGTELVTSSRRPASGGTLTYTLTYTAPAAVGSAKLCATGMWSTGSGAGSSDFWAFAPDKAITITPLATTVPNVPNIASPANGAANQAKFGLRFVWNKAAYAEKYFFQLSSSNTFSTTLYSDTTITDSSVTVANAGMSGNTQYFWRVLAKNSVGSSAWSNVYDFTTVAGNPISGTKTIGGASPDYATIRAALNDLTQLGVAAPGVTFAIRAGTYSEDSLTVQTLSTSAAAPVVIMPESGSVILNGAGSTTSPFVIKIDNTPYVTIDGGDSHSLLINGTSANAQKGVFIFGNSQYTTVKNCVIRAGAYSSNTYVGVDVSSGLANIAPHNSWIENNIIRNAYYGVRLTGNSATDSLLRVTVCKNLVDSVAAAGIYSTAIAYGKFYNNDISVLLGGGTALTTAMYGIFAGTSTDYVRVYNNRIHDINQQSASTSITYGISSNTGAAGHGGNVIYNNIIAMNITQSNGTGSIYPIYGSESSIADSVLFNTVKLTGTGTGIRTSTAYYKGSATGTCVVKNNILINLRTDGATGVATAIGRPSTATTATMSSNNNDLYVGTTGTQHHLARLSAVTYYDAIATWSAANSSDAASISEDVQFVSTTDLHITPGTTTGVKNAGTPIPGYTTDIDGQPRNATTPDMGADEFSGSFTSVGTEVSSPSDYALHQNYPNPFNPSTSISFAVKSTQHATLKVYSMIGQEIKTLFDNTAVGGQVQVVNFDASALASGVYYYSLRTADRYEIKKMMLLK